MTYAVKEAHDAAASGGDVMVSARFLRGEDEKKARAFEKELRAKGVKISRCRYE